MKTGSSENSEHDREVRRQEEPRQALDAEHPLDATITGSTARAGSDATRAAVPEDEIGVAHGRLPDRSPIGGLHRQVDVLLDALERRVDGQLVVEHLADAGGQRVHHRALEAPALEAVGGVVHLRDLAR